MEWGAQAASVHAKRTSFIAEVGRRGESRGLLQGITNDTPTMLSLFELLAGLSKPLRCLQKCPEVGEYLLLSQRQN